MQFVDWDRFTQVVSQKFTQDQVQHIADLARISLSEEEKQKFQEDLGAVLDYIDKLQQVDVSGVEPLAQVSGLENQTREDENGSSHAEAGKLVSIAPETKDGYVKAGQVLTK